MNETVSVVGFMEALRRIMTGITDDLPLDRLLPRCLDAAVQGLGAQAGSIYFPDNNDETLVFSHVVGGAGDILRGLHIPTARSLSGMVLRTGRASLTAEAERDPNYCFVPGGFPVHAMMTAPIPGKDGKPIAVIQVLNPQDGRQFAEEELSVLETIGALLSTAIERSRSLESERRISLVLSAVHRVAMGLFSRPWLDEIVPEILAISLESVEAEAGSVLLYDASDDTLVFRHVVGGAGSALIGGRIPSGNGIAGAVFQSGEPCITMDARRDPRHLIMPYGYRTQALVTVPLRNVGGRTVGVMQVLNKTGGGTFDADHDLVILETLASLAATAIENAQQSELERRAAVAEAAAMIAHDLKNLMSPVTAWGQFLTDVGLDAAEAFERLEPTAAPEQGQNLEKIRDLLLHLPTAVEAVLDGAQTSMDRGAEIADALAGHVRTPVFVCEDIARTIERVCKTLEPLARAEGLRILRSGEARPFYHDRTHIFNAVYNLVHNAISHVSAGGTVCVILSEVDSWVEIRVKDDGRGMPERVRTSLFTTKPISTTPGGTGLGTRIVQRVVELHRGSVQVESEPGYGTEVLMRIPMSQPDEHLSENGVKPKA